MFPYEIICIIFYILNSIKLLKIIHILIVYINWIYHFDNNSLKIKKKLFFIKKNKSFYTKKIYLTMFRIINVNSIFILFCPHK